MIAVYLSLTSSVCRCNCSTLGEAVRLLQGANDRAEEDGSRESGRNLRSSALRFWATVLQRFPDGANYNCFWPRFLQAVDPQMERMPTEVLLHSQVLLLCILQHPYITEKHVLLSMTTGGMHAS